MNNDLVKRLRADELPGDSQNKREARMELGKILDEAADRIEQLENVLQEITELANIPETPPTKIGAETDIMWGCLGMCSFMARDAMGELDEQ